MWTRDSDDPSPYDDDWEDQPSQGPLYQWGLGVLLPLCLSAYGARAIANQTAEFGGRITMELHGLNATAFGIAWLSAALFVHCHYFWGNIYDQAWFAVLGKIFAAIGFIAVLATVLIRNGVLGLS